MKRVLALLLALTLIFALAACGEQKTKEQKEAEEALEALGIEPDEAEDLADALADELGIDPDDYVADPNANNDKTYGAAVSFYTNITNALDPLVNNIIDANNERIEEAAGEDDYYWEDPAYISLYYLPFLSTSLIMTECVTDTVSESTVKMMYELWGEQDVTFTVNSPGNYTITYKSPDWSDESIVDDVRIEMLYDEATHSIRYASYVNGEQSYFYEYIGLGNDTYALQSRGDRALVTYKDGVITSLYHSQGIWEEDYETGELSDMTVCYDSETDSIWGKTVGRDWVTERTGNLEYVFDYDGTNLIVTRMDDEYDWETGESTWTMLDPVTIPAQ